MSKSIIEQAADIFKAKLSTGKYKHYDERALEFLFADCVTQCATMASVNSRRATA